MRSCRSKVPKFKNSNFFGNEKTKRFLFTWTSKLYHYPSRFFFLGFLFFAKLFTPVNGRQDSDHIDVRRFEKLILDGHQRTSNTERTGRQQHNPGYRIPHFQHSINPYRSSWKRSMTEFPKIMARAEVKNLFAEKRHSHSPTIH